MYKALALVLVHLKRRKIFMLWCFWGKKHTHVPLVRIPGWIRGDHAPGVTGRTDRSSEFERTATSEGEGEGVRVRE